MATLTVDKSKLKIGNRYFFRVNIPFEPVANATLTDIIPARNNVPVQYVFSDYQIGRLTVPGLITMPENYITKFYVFATNGSESLPRLPSEIFSEISKFGGSKRSDLRKHSDPRKRSDQRKRRSTRKRH